MGVGIIFSRHDIFPNYSQILEIFSSLSFSQYYFILSNIYIYIFFFFNFFSFKNLPWKQNHSDMFVLFIYIIIIKLGCSWIHNKIFANWNNICEIANKSSIHQMKLWRLGIGIYLLPKYQRIDLWQIYSWTIRWTLPMTGWWCFDDDLEG